MKTQGHFQTVSIPFLMTLIIKASFEVKSQVSFNTYFNEKEFTKPMNKQVKISTNHFSLLTLTLSKNIGHNSMLLESISIHEMDRRLHF